ncbi:uncharacterized protein LOC143301212 [Babylonia areolata]|uniref:uncharacterized protein LOC143301212 n=1 Tax=Babylonia areolata TaxID=304850 RepID=UPI003FD21D5F
MALSVAFPPVPPLPSEPAMMLSAMTEPSLVFPPASCVFGPFAGPGAIKREPQTPPDTGPPPPSFLHPPPAPTPPPPSSFNPLSSVNFSHLKHGNTDFYPKRSEGAAQADEQGQEGLMNSWTYKHPEHWEPKEVLDWVFSLTEDLVPEEEGEEEEEEEGGALFRGEAFNALTGRQLRDMSLDDFRALDQRYGARVHDVFNFLLEDANFKQPLPPESFQAESFHGNVPLFDFLHAPDDVTAPPRPPPPPPSTAPSMSVYVDRQGREMTVSLDGLGLYDIDVDFTSIASKFPPHNRPNHKHNHRHLNKAHSNLHSNLHSHNHNHNHSHHSSLHSHHHRHRPIDDSDYNSGSEAGPEIRPRSASSSDGFEPLFSDREDGEGAEEGEGRMTDGDMEVETGPVAEGDRGMVGKPHTCLSSSTSSSCDSGCEGDDEKAAACRKRQSSQSKGNHLWEFIRDLLQNPVFNPSLVRWEDRAQGVFKFVQSEAVAQLWGRKKNNPQMTYEKLSRAMRFCRSAGYFESVPKTGRFPKKLCFKFGHKAHGWQE